MELNKLYNEDCLEFMKHIPDHYIDMILTDPPYFKIKNCWWDNQWNNEDKYLEWFNLIIKEWKRILKINGSIYCFASSILSNKVENLISDEFRVLNRIIWEKENDPGFDGWKQKCSKKSLRKWYSYREDIIFAENKISFGEILKKERISKGISTIKLAEMIGAYGEINHGGSVSNWETGKNIPTELQYQKLQILFNLPPRNNIVRQFDVATTPQFTDVWHFKTVKPYKGKHPCEKPADLIQHIIKSSTCENDIILDCFAGSGSTLKQASILNRRYIGCEISEGYFKEACKYLKG